MSKYDTFNQIEIPVAMQQSWCDAVTTLANTLDVPASLVMRVHSDEIEVFARSNNPDNVYQLGERAPLNSGLYCETVMDTRKELLIANALKDPVWDHNPDLKLGMISYYGLPVCWPNGALFGTICMLDRKENHYSELARSVLQQYQQLIQANLELLFERYLLEQTEHQLDKGNTDLKSIADTYYSKAIHHDTKFHHLIKFHQSSYFLYLHDTEGVFTYISPSIEKMLGFKPEEYMENYQQFLTDNPVNQRVLDSTRLTLKGIEQPPYEAEILNKNGTTHWIEVKEIPVFDKSGKVIAVEGIAHDINDRKKVEHDLRQSLIGTIKAVSKAVGARDPYTANHQQRVARLSRKIAQEMGLNPEMVEGIRMGALIHDIGKIQLPSEILSKPLKLSLIEYNLIKTHPQIGYDILKDIKFPWPVAEIALHHHERLDGSGYPLGLKGDEVSLQARIVAVADVVEAISSDRPYRPALGIDAALHEIKKYRGTLFDTDVVDACLTAFDDGFDFDY